MWYQSYLIKQAEDFAQGLPDPKRFGTPTQLPTGKTIPYVVQRHLAERAGPHYDVRFGAGSPVEPDMFSWATKKELPQPGGRTALYQQPLHRGQYAHFEGTLTHGYGKGTVKTHDKGSVIISKAEPNQINFVVAHKKNPEFFTLIRRSGPPTDPKTTRQRASQGGTWLLVNTTPVSASKLLGGPPAQVGLNKLKYTTVPESKVEKLFDPKYLVQEKIDGASALYHILADKINVLSYRQSVAGKPIVHTYRVFGAGGAKASAKLPQELVGTILRGEIYGSRAGKTIPAQELGGILNSSVQGSLERQTNQNVSMKNLIFDIVREGKNPIAPNTLGAEERINKIKQVLKYLPKQNFSVPETAETPEEARALWERIKGGQNPRTSEGIIAWPRAPGKPPIKTKLMPEADVWVKSIFPGEGKYKGVGAGGFEYSNAPTGSIVGKVGTGFSDQSRADMHNDPDAWLNRMAKIRSQGKFPNSGAHRAPAFLALHEDYSPVFGKAAGDNVSSPSVTEPISPNPAPSPSPSPISTTPNSMPVASIAPPTVPGPQKYPAVTTQPELQTTGRGYISLPETISRHYVNAPGGFEGAVQRASKAPVVGEAIKYDYSPEVLNRKYDVNYNAGNVETVGAMGTFNPYKKQVNLADGPRRNYSTLEHELTHGWASASDKDDAVSVDAVNQAAYPKNKEGWGGNRGPVPGYFNSQTELDARIAEMKRYYVASHPGEDVDSREQAAKAIDWAQKGYTRTKQPGSDVIHVPAGDIHEYDSRKEWPKFQEYILNRMPGVVNSTQQQAPSWKTAAFLIRQALS